MMNTQNTYSNKTTSNLFEDKQKHQWQTRYQKDCQNNAKSWMLNQAKTNLNLLDLEKFHNNQLTQGIMPKKKQDSNSIKNINSILKSSAVFTIIWSLNTKTRMRYTQFFNNFKKSQQNLFYGREERDKYLIKATQNIGNILKRIIFMNQRSCKEISFQKITKISIRDNKIQSTKINNKFYQQYNNQYLTKITEKDEQQEDYVDLIEIVQLNQKSSQQVSKKIDSFPGKTIKNIVQNQNNSKKKLKNLAIHFQFIKFGKCSKIVTNMQQEEYIFRPQRLQQNISEILIPFKPMQLPLTQTNDFSGNINHNFWVCNKLQNKSFQLKRQNKQEKCISESNKGLSNVSTLTISTNFNNQDSISLFGGQAVNFKNSLVRQRQTFNKIQKQNKKARQHLQSGSFTPIKIHNPYQKQKPMKFEGDKKQNNKKLIIITNKNIIKAKQKIENQFISFSPILKQKFRPNQLKDQQSKFIHQNVTNYKLNQKQQFISEQFKFSLSQINKKSQVLANYFQIPIKKQFEPFQNIQKRKQINNSSYSQQFLDNAKISLENMRNNFHKRKSQSLVTQKKDQDKFLSTYKINQNSRTTLPHPPKQIYFNSLKNTVNSKDFPNYSIASTPKKKQRNDSYVLYSANMKQQFYPTVTFDKNHQNSYYINHSTFERQSLTASKNSHKKPQMWKNTLITLRNEQILMGSFQQPINMQKFRQLDLKFHQKSNSFDKKYKIRQNELKIDDKNMKFYKKQNQSNQFKNFEFSLQL